MPMRREIFLTRLRVRGSLLLLGLDRTVRRAQARTGKAGAPAGADARALAGAVESLMGPRAPGSVTGSLVLLEVLARRGIAARLCVGVLPVSELPASAWVEVGDERLFEPGAEGVLRIVRL